MQTDLTRLNKEVSTGRLADAGLTLGAESGSGVTLHIDLAGLSAITDSNATVSMRLDHTKAALDRLATGANDFLQQLIASRDSNTSTSTLAQQAAAAFNAFTDAANATDGHNYLFAGVNTAVAPIADYASGPQAAVDAAFLAKFGFTQSDPQVANIDAASMKDFLDNQFAPLFDDPNWGSTWSSASNQTIKSRVSQTESLDTSVSANQPAFRKLAMVYTMVAKLGTGSLGTDARQAVIDKAISVLASGISDLTDAEAGVGIAQNRVSAATDRVTAQQTILQTRIASLEGVDPAEAKVKIDSLTTQIEMSYSLTSQFLKLSILNYITA